MSSKLGPWSGLQRRAEVARTDPQEQDQSVYSVLRKSFKERRELSSEESLEAAGHPELAATWDAHCLLSLSNNGVLPGPSAMLPGVVRLASLTPAST